MDAPGQTPPNPAPANKHHRPAPHQLGGVQQGALGLPPFTLHTFVALLAAPARYCLPPSTQYAPSSHASSSFLVRIFPLPPSPSDPDGIPVTGVPVSSSVKQRSTATLMTALDGDKRLSFVRRSHTYARTFARTRGQTSSAVGLYGAVRGYSAPRGYLACG